MSESCISSHKQVSESFVSADNKCLACRPPQITRLRLARNKKSGASRGFAFIEFEDNEVIQIC